MTLTTYADMEQRSDEWYAARLGILTASAIGLLLTSTLKVANNDTSRGLTNLLVAQRITGWIEPTYQSPEMFRGVMDEPLARDLYSATYAPVTEVGFMVREFDGCKLGYSPDGLVGDDGLIEVKSRAPKKHLATILADEVPAENMAQIQAGLFVSGREWCDYLSYCGGMPMWRRRVTADHAWFSVIDSAVRDFEIAATDSVHAYTIAVDGLPNTERVEYFPDTKEFTF